MADENRVGIEPNVVAMLGELRSRCAEHRADVQRMIERAEPGSGVAVGRALASAYDSTLRELFEAASQRFGMTGPVVLGAVGSYGRESLGLHSDLDVRLVYEGDRSCAEQLAEAVLYPMWDLGVRVGHQVLEVGDVLALANTDSRTATTVLDWRTIAGDRDFANRLLQRAYAALFAGPAVHEFVAGLEHDTRVRHERFGASVYLLEPDLKLGAGGLRDLDVTVWCARARWRMASAEDLERAGVLVHGELVRWLEARDHLWRVRNQLHLVGGRNTNRLTYDQQERLAPVLGYGRGTAGAESFMSAHYQYASVISRVRETVAGKAMQQARTRRPEERDLGGGLKLFGGSVVSSVPINLLEQPAQALRIYEEAVLHQAPIHRSTREAIRRALLEPAARQAVFHSPHAHACFRTLCATVQETKLRDDSILGDMHDVGLLTALVPEFEPVVGRVHHDVYHVYTVDVHSIAAVDFLRSLARGAWAEEHPLASRLATELARPQVLFLAALLHDVGKAIGRSDHARRGAVAARDIATRLGYRHHEVEAVALLVLQHLALYHLATRRDIDDPAVVEEVCSIVQGREGLRELYLLTFVDVSTTGPEAMTSWKSSLLEQLYYAVDARMRTGGGLHRDRSAAVRARMDHICSQAGSPADVAAFLESMPERYLMGTAPERIQRHAAMVAARQLGTLQLDVFTPESAPAAEVCVVADDRPGLLASIAAVLAANGLSVLQAQVYSRLRDDGLAEAVDLFYVQGPAGDAGAAERVQGKVQKDLTGVLWGGICADELVRPRLRALHERPTPAVQTRVVVDNRASLKHTVVEVFTRDRPGLLYLLASTFRDLDLSIEIAKINTEGSRVADVFYVCEAGGSKVESPERIERIRERVRQLLDGSMEQER